MVIEPDQPAAVQLRRRQHLLGDRLGREADQQDVGVVRQVGRPGFEVVHQGLLGADPELDHVAPVPRQHEPCEYALEIVAHDDRGAHAARSLRLLGNRRLLLRLLRRLGLERLLGPVGLLELFALPRLRRLLELRGSRAFRGLELRRALVGLDAVGLQCGLDAVGLQRLAVHASGLRDLRVRGLEHWLGGRRSALRLASGTASLADRSAVELLVDVGGASGLASRGSLSPPLQSRRRLRSLLAVPRFLVLEATPPTAPAATASGPLCIGGGRFRFGLPPGRRRPGRR